MKEKKKTGGLAMAVLVNVLVALVLGAVYAYFTLPVLNPHSYSFYFFLTFLCLVYCLTALLTSALFRRKGDDSGGYFHRYRVQCLPIAVLFGVVFLVFVFGNLFSSPPLRVSPYKDLLQVETGDFSADVTEISFDQIPMLDDESAHRLGSRVLGDLDDMVSQFELSETYSQINYQGRPVRVAYLEYGDLAKWFTNHEEGIPAYIIIDMVTQEAEVVRLQEGMKYSPSEHFGRNLTRHLRFQYPTYLFSTPVFELDEAGQPWWICPKVEKTIGLFGGEDIHGAVLVNAITGESSYYEEVPTWVDRVYPASLIISQYDYHGLFLHGFWNAIFGQKDVTVTTDGYNYIALHDDVYMYTGITSVTSDQSNIGFLLSNLRTKETKYYRCSGATEYSAMGSAQGVVQHLGYQATFPLLLNVSGEPTYFMALKDNAALVKMYAMVNVRQYTIVATGNTLAECEQQYIRLLAQNNLTTEVELPETNTRGVLAEIRSAVLDGNSYYFLRLEGENVFYSLSAASCPLVVTLDPGDWVSLEHAPADMQTTGSILDAYSLSLLEENDETAAPQPEDPPSEPTE